MRIALIALGALLALSETANAAELVLRPRPVPKPVTESRTVRPQQQMLFDEFMQWLRGRR